MTFPPEIINTGGEGMFRRRRDVQEEKGCSGGEGMFGRRRDVREEKGCSRLDRSRKINTISPANHAETFRNFTLQLTQNYSIQRSPS